MKKIGIIDVGGGTRSIFGAGVYDYLIDNNIEIPYPQRDIYIRQLPQEKKE